MEDELYKQNILDHYRHSQRRGRLAVPPAVIVSGNNPSCGDALSFSVLVDGGQITDARFDGEGCAISQASASMLLDRIIGKSIDEVKHISKEEVYALLGVPISESREKCALLALSALNRLNS